MSEILLCPQCKTQIHRPADDIALMYCFKCGKKINLTKEPLRAGVVPRPDVPPPTRTATAPEFKLPEEVSQARAQRGMPSFTPHRYRQPTLRAVERANHPRKQSLTALFVGGALLGAILMILMVIGGMLLIANLENKPPDQNPMIGDMPLAGRMQQPISSGDSFTSEPVGESDPRGVTRDNNPATHDKDLYSGKTVDGLRPSFPRNSKRWDSGLNRAAGTESLPDRDLSPATEYPHESFISIARRSTVLIKNGDRIGSAFCIDKLGVFVTAASVVEGINSGEYVELVLDSGQRNAKTYFARVAAIDQKTNVALLTAITDDQFPKIDLGTASELVDREAVMAVGYPDLQPYSKNFDPPARDKAGMIIAVERRDDEITRIQTDVWVEEAGVGGPIIDSEGQVVAVAATRTSGSGVNSAIPVEYAKRLLQGSYAKISAPIYLTAAEARRPFEVHLDVFSPINLPLFADTHVLVTRETFPMEQDGNHFTSTIELSPDLDVRALTSITLVVQAYVNESESSGRTRLVRVSHEINIGVPPSKTRRPVSPRGRSN